MSDQDAIRSTGAKERHSHPYPINEALLFRSFVGKLTGPYRRTLNFPTNIGCFSRIPPPGFLLYCANYLIPKQFRMKQTFIALATLAGLALFSCQSPTSTTAPASGAGTSALDSVTPNPHGGGGRYVPASQIAPCLQAYQTLMAQYGITTDSPAVPIQKCPPATLRITLSESFTYTSLRHLLDSLALSIDSAGKGANVNIQVLPGIITQDLATAYNMPPSHVGRITYFLVPTLIDTSSAPKLKTRALTLSGGGTGGGGSEVGGLEP